MRPKWQHTLAYSEPLRFLLPSPWPPEMESGVSLGRGRGHSSTTATVCGPTDTFIFSPWPPVSPLKPSHGVCPPQHTLSTAYWLHVNFLENMTPLRDPCGSVAATSAILFFASDAHIGGAMPSLLPLSPKDVEQSSILEPYSPRPPSAPSKDPPSSNLFNQHLLSV